MNDRGTGREREGQGYLCWPHDIMMMNFVWFGSYGISTLMSYLIPNPVYKYIMNIICKHIFLIKFLNKPKLSCPNFWDEAWWFLSLRVFGLLSSSLLLFPQRFNRYVLRPSSGVCQTREPSRNSFFCTQLNSFKFFYLIRIIQFTINHLFAHS